jgi:hypothetical protein
MNSPYYDIAGTRVNQNKKKITKSTVKVFTSSSAMQGL